MRRVVWKLLEVLFWDLLVVTAADVAMLVSRAMTSRREHGISSPDQLRDEVRAFVRSLSGQPLP